MYLKLGTAVRGNRFHVILLSFVFILALPVAKAQKDVGGSNRAESGVDVPQAVLALLHERCSICHVELRQKPSLLLNDRRWLTLSNGRFKMEQRISATPPHGMPPGTPLSLADRGVLEQWFDVMRANR